MVSTATDSDTYAAAELFNLCHMAQHFDCVLLIHTESVGQIVPTREVLADSTAADDGPQSLLLGAVGFRTGSRLIGTEHG
jgi:hypothetical protein